MKNTRKIPSKDEIVIRKAIERLDAVKEKAIQKLSTSALQAQTHIGVLFKVRNDLTVLNELLDELVQKEEVKQEIPTPAFLDSDTPETDPELLKAIEEAVETPKRGGRPKGSPNKPKV